MTHSFTIEIPSPIVQACDRMKELCGDDELSSTMAQLRPTIEAVRRKLEEDSCEDEDCNLEDGDHMMHLDEEDEDDSDDPVAFVRNSIPQFEGTGLFPLMSYLNHSCTPNAEVRYINGNGSAVVIALKPIQVGEEVCVSYIDEEAPFEDRMEMLASYKFKCKCEKCRTKK
jgi:hypothetical protein